jgi:hypothetical protein
MFNFLLKPEKEPNLRRSISVLFAMVAFASIGSASADQWRNHSNCSSNAGLGTIQGLQYVSDSNGDRVYIKFASDSFVSRLVDFGSDNARFNRFYSTLLSVQSSGQSVTDIYVADCSSGAIMKGLSVGTFW